MTKVTYSVKTTIGGSGIGRTAWHQVKPLLDENLLEMAYAPGQKGIAKEKFFAVPYLNGPYLYQDIFFDAFVSQVIMQKPEIIQGWGSHCLFTIREFPDAISIVNLYSAHPDIQEKLLKNINPPDPILANKVRKELEECDHIFIPSEWVLDSLRKVGLDHKAKIVPFGVDLEKFIPDKSAKDDTFRVIYVGNNWLRKGLISLLGAWISLDLKNAELIVAGVKELPEEITSKLPKNVKVGWVEDLVKSYQQSDVFCLSAIEDGNPLSVYEAMACGVVPIVSSNTGTKQHIFPGTNGFIIPPNNPKNIASLLQEMYDDRSMCVRMGKNARKFIEAFPWERHEKEYVKFIKSL